MLSYRVKPNMLAKGDSSQHEEKNGEYEWIGLTHLPKTSWIPVPKKDFIDDMDLTGLKLTTLVEKDIPRSVVRIYGVRIQLPELFQVLINRVIPRHAREEVLALCTQSCMACPLRSLHATLSPNLVVAERINQTGKMVVDIDPNYKNTKSVSVHVQKPLRIARVGKGHIYTVKNITIDIVYRSDKPFVHVNLAT